MKNSNSKEKRKRDMQTLSQGFEGSESNELGREDDEESYINELSTRGQDLLLELEKLWERFLFVIIVDYC